MGSEPSFWKNWKEGVVPEDCKNPRSALISALGAGTVTMRLIWSPKDGR